MARIAPRRQAQIVNEKRSKFRELFPSLVAELGISDKELFSFLNEEFDIPLVDFKRGREKSREIPMQSKDEAYDIMKTDDFREKLEDRFSALEEPPAEEPPAEEPRVAAKKVDFDSETGMEGEAIDDYGLSDARAAEKDLANKTRRTLRGSYLTEDLKAEAARQASNEGMAGALKSEAARQASVSAEKASNEGMAGALKSEAARQASVAAEAKKPVTRGDLDPDMQDMMGTTGVDPDDYDLAGGAEEPEVDYTQQAVDLFKTVHATEYDPKSSMDKGKLEKMKTMLAKQGGLGDMSANQFALQVYRNS